MGKLIMITGGARSGKSAFAEKLLKGMDDVLYIATGIPFDDEMRDRIARHRERRNKKWITAEAYKSLDKIIYDNAGSIKHVLLDCVTLLVNNLMLDDDIAESNSISAEKADRIEKKVSEEIKAILSAASNFRGETIIVTNELGMGIVPGEPLGRLYRDIAGRMNQIIADAADEVYLLVSGISIRIK